MMKQMMTVICSATLAACGSAPVRATPVGISGDDYFDYRQRTADNFIPQPIRGRQDIDIYPQVSGTLTKTLCGGRTGSA